MRRYWIWGLTFVGLLLVVALSMPKTPNSRGERIAEPHNLVPGTPTRTGPDIADLPTPGKSVSWPITTAARLNTRIQSAALSVEGVNQAWAAARGTTALVGLSIDESLKGPAESEIREDVADQVRELPEIERVAVTTDPTLIRRIRSINEAMATDQSPTEYDPELRDLISRLSPSAE